MKLLVRHTHTQVWRTKPGPCRDLVLRLLLEDELTDRSMQEPCGSWSLKNTSRYEHVTLVLSIVL